MIRLGLIGAGHWGKKWIATIDARQDCMVRVVARRESFLSAESIVSLGTSGDLDGVICATEPEHQALVATMCAKAGVPLIVEKPLGLSAGRARNVLIAFEHALRKAPLIVDYIQLWAPAFVELRRRVNDRGGASCVSSITSCGYNNGPVRAYSPLYDYGPHDIAMAMTLLGPERQLESVAIRGVTRHDDGRALYEPTLSLGGVPMLAVIGNGGDRKARSFTVTMNDFHEFEYDDCREHPHKLLDDGAALLEHVDTTSPMDCVLNDFIAQIKRWRAGTWDPEPARSMLNLSVRVNGALDAIAGAVS